MDSQQPYDMYMEEPQIQKTSDDVYASQLQEEKIRNVLEQIAPDNQLLDLQWRIKGYIRNPVTKMWEKVDKNAPEPDPILVSRYISYLSSILNQNTTLSNYSSSEINQVMKLVIEWLSDDLKSNGEKYGLGSDYSERTRIGHIILNETFAALKRAQNGMESRRIFSALNVHEALGQYGQKKGGITDALKFWK